MINSHVFQPSVGQPLPKYGNPAGLPVDLQPTYPHITHAANAALHTVFDAIHIQAQRTNLRSSDIASLRQYLRRSSQENVARGAQVAALALATADQVTVNDADGVPEAGKIVTETLRLLRHRLGVESGTIAGRIAESSLFNRRQMGAKAPQQELPRILGNGLIGLSFAASLLTPEKVDKNIAAFHTVLTRDDGAKPGLGGQYKLQLPVIETMLTIGSADKMAGCYPLAIAWIYANATHLSNADRTRLAKICIEHYSKIINSPARYNAYNALYRLKMELDLDAKKQLSDCIHAAKQKLQKESREESREYRELEEHEKHDPDLAHFRKAREAAEETRSDDGRPEGSMSRQLREDYKTLQLSAEATNDELKRQYKQLALKYHPDKCRRHGIDSEEGKVVFQKIKDAYQRINASRNLV